MASLVLDQWSKAWIRSNLRVGESMGIPLPGFFEITHTENHGIAFGLFQGGGIFFAPVAIVIALAVAAWSYRKPEEPWYLHSALGLLASGALGNLVDRAAFGRVTDMLWFRAIDFPVFNIADSCITIGAILMIVASLLEGKAKTREALPAPDPVP